MYKLRSLKIDDSGNITVINNLVLKDSKNVNRLLTDNIPVIFDNTISKNKVLDTYNILEELMSDYRLYLCNDSKRQTKDKLIDTLKWFCNGEEYKLEYNGVEELLHKISFCIVLLSKNIDAYKTLPSCTIDADGININMCIIAKEFILKSKLDFDSILGRKHNVIKQMCYDLILYVYNKTIKPIYYNYLQKRSWTKMLDAGNILDIDTDIVTTMEIKKYEVSLEDANYLKKMLHNLALKLKKFSVNKLHFKISLPKTPVRLVYFKYLPLLFLDSEIDKNTGAITFPKSKEYLDAIKYILDVLSDLDLNYLNKLYWSSKEDFWGEVIDESKGTHNYIGVFSFLNDFKWLIYPETLPLLLSIVHLEKLNKKALNKLYIYTDVEGILLGEK